MKNGKGFGKDFIIEELFCFCVEKQMWIFPLDQDYFGV